MKTATIPISERPFAAFDIDGTLIRWQLYHAVADALARAGHIDKQAYQAIQEARMDWKRRTGPEAFKSYEQQLVNAYNKLITRINIGQFEQATQAVFDEYKDQAYTYTRDLIKSLKAKNYLLFAISNSQTEIVKKIASYYEFDDCVGSDYERQDSRFTGQVSLHLTDKDMVLKQLAAKHRASYKQSVAIGDSASDIPMLQFVEQPIAFNPEKKLFDHAVKQEWPLVIERKNTIYKLEISHGKYILA